MVVVPARIQAVARRALKRLLAFVNDSGPPRISHPGRVFGLADVFSVHPSARLDIADPANGPDARIVLGRGVYVGQKVELTAARGCIVIDDDSSIQHDSIIAGDVKIGAHCLFGKYVFVASTAHRFRDRPEWLIRDQDRHASRSADPAISRLIRIEDDCWIGQSVVVNPGVYVGRGAVIGANSVVTRDIGPFEVHGGVPNRLLSRRLDFKPPLSIDAARDEDMPYFYRGFFLSQDGLNRSRDEGVVAARSSTCIVLARPAGGRLRLSGRRLGTEPVRLDVKVNGAACVSSVVNDVVFTIEADLPIASADVAGDVPAALRAFTYIEIHSDAVGGGYGVSSASVESAGYSDEVVRVPT